MRFQQLRYFQFTSGCNPIIKSRKIDLSIISINVLSPPRPSPDKDTILVCSLCKYSWRTSYCICSEAILPKPLSYRNTTTWQDAFENMAWLLNIFLYFFEYSYPTSSLALHSAGNHIPWQERARISSGISITQIKQHFFFLPRHC